jgi:hypothetical protein
MPKHVWEMDMNDIYDRQEIYSRVSWWAEELGME